MGAIIGWGLYMDYYRDLPHSRLSTRELSVSAIEQLFRASQDLKTPGTDEPI